MDAIVYNKVEEEANRIIRAIQQSGGGGGAFDVVQEVTISDDTTHRVQIDLPVNWQDTYNYIFMFAETPATYTQREWIYIDFNGSNSLYNPLTLNSINFFRYNILYRDNNWYISKGTSTENYGIVIIPTGTDYIRFYLFNDSSYFKPGTKFSIYAAKINQ